MWGVPIDIIDRMKRNMKREIATKNKTSGRSSMTKESVPENCKGMALTVDEFHKQLDKVGVSHKQPK